MVLFDFFTITFIEYLQKRLFEFINNVRNIPKKRNGNLEIIEHTCNYAEILEKDNLPNDEKTIFYNLTKSKCQCVKRFDGSACIHPFFWLQKASN